VSKNKISNATCSEGPFVHRSGAKEDMACRFKKPNEVNQVPKSQSHTLRMTKVTIHAEAAISCSTRWWIRAQRRKRDIWSSNSLSFPMEIVAVRTLVSASLS